MGRDPFEIREDIQLAGRALTDAFEGLRRRGWLPLLTLGAALAAGIVLQRNRPAREVAARSRGVVDRTLQVATALAAIERFRTRTGRRRAA
jgi:hypothetical protein